MTERGFTQNSLAREIGISQGTVSAWLLKDSKPKGRRLTDLANVLGVPLNWLLLGKGDDVISVERPTEIAETRVDSSALLQEVPGSWTEQMADLPECWRHLKDQIATLETHRHSPLAIRANIGVMQAILERADYLAATQTRRPVSYREILKRPPTTETTS